MTIQRLQDQSKALTEVITLFSKEAKVYAQDIDNLASQYCFRMTLEEKRQHRFDGVIDVVMGMTTVAATFFGGSFGRAITTSVNNIYKAPLVDGSLKERVANTLRVAVTSDLTNYIAAKTISADIRGFSMTDPMTGKKNYDPTNELYTAKYKAQNCINEFLNTMVKSGDRGAIDSKTVEEKIDYLQRNQDRYAEYALNQAILMVTLRLYHLKSITKGINYKTNLLYISLANLVAAVQPAERHLGTKAREVYNRFYADKDKLGDMTPEEVKQVRQELLKKVIHSEVMASDSSYNRKYKKLSFTNNGLQSESLESYPVYELRQVGQVRQAEYSITREQFFKVIDTKVTLWAYFDDYNSYFNKKLGAEVKREISKIIPDHYQKHWKETFGNDLRVRDLAMVYLIKVIPEFILNEPIFSSSLTGENLSDAMNQYLSALYNGMSSACYFYLEFYSLRNRVAGRYTIRQRDIDDAVTLSFCLAEKIKGILCAPLYRVKVDAAVSPLGKEKLKIYGLDEEHLNEHNQKLNSNAFLTLVNAFDLSKVKGFAEDSTPIDKGILPTQRNELATKVFDRLKTFILSWDTVVPYVANHANDYQIHAEINQAFADVLPKPTAILSLTKTEITHAQITHAGEDFKNISEFYQDRGNQRYVSGGIAVKTGMVEAGNERTEYGNYGEKYLQHSLTSLNTKVGATSQKPELNKASRYFALQKSFLKQRLSLQAYHHKKASIEDVLENMEETMLLITAELFADEEEVIENIKNSQQKEIQEQKERA
ncbi:MULTISPECIES: hypothetical protein [Cysteiniphilum]|uniref:Uncharacterized protein n=1 Tax=Cysteiniphilum litorale TaxID=2056700 RepID=A0A8J3E9C9_9GAMM|nr:MULTISPECIES: hypothetical protein [Cysteiniphilum]GGF98366.1 hypothetical protein GCM10010995_14510 [Cysteiniphilum litorale]